MRDLDAFYSSGLWITLALFPLAIEQRRLMSTAFNKLLMARTCKEEEEVEKTAAAYTHMYIK